LDVYSYLKITKERYLNLWEIDFLHHTGTLHFMNSWSDLAKIKCFPHFLVSLWKLM